MTRQTVDEQHQIGLWAYGAVLGWCDAVSGLVQQDLDHATGRGYRAGFSFAGTHRVSGRVRPLGDRFCHSVIKFIEEHSVDITRDFIPQSE